MTEGTLDQVLWSEADWCLIDGDYHDVLPTLSDLSVAPGDVVLDATAGSSTTGVAALRRGLRYIGIERLPEHVRTSRERLAGVTAETNLVGLRLKRNQQKLFG